jgi:ATP-dependent DNA ligase
MRLPVSPPVEPMLAKSADSVPVAENLYYEPKFDGFRCIVFRDGDTLELGSRTGKPLNRYFPEVVETLLAQLPERCVVDGEIILVRPGDDPTLPGGMGRLDFDALSNRLHPAASRVNLLAKETPASFVAFDLLALGDDSLLDAPYTDRRARLEEVLTEAAPPLHLTPVTTDPETALRWFDVFEGAGLDGLVCKPGESRYAPGKRLMTKVKHARTADVVVAGFRWHKSGPVIGSLLLGLYDADGRLQHVGVSASFTAKRREQLVDEVAPYREDALAGHPWASWATPDSGDPERMPGGPSRWSGGKDLSWIPLRPALVAEVAYDHMEGLDGPAPRFRHTARMLRWRPDREAASCTYEQLEIPVRYDLDAVLAGRSPV